MKFELFTINRILLEKYDRLYAMVDDNGEIPDTEESACLQKEIEQDELTKEQLAIEKGKYHKNVIAMAQAHMVESARQKKLADRLFMFAERQIEPDIASGINVGDKISSPEVSISWRKSEQTVIGVPVSKLPDIYRRVKTTEEADKPAIKAAIKGGKLVEGCSVVQVQNLQIK